MVTYPRLSEQAHDACFCQINFWRIVILSLTTHCVKSISSHSELGEKYLSHCEFSK